MTNAIINNSIAYRSTESTRIGSFCNAIYNINSEYRTNEVERGGNRISMFFAFLMGRYKT